jgi:hypothetical protein
MKANGTSSTERHRTTPKCRNRRQHPTSAPIGGGAVSVSLPWLFRDVRHEESKARVGRPHAPTSLKLGVLSERAAVNRGIADKLVTAR